MSVNFKFFKKIFIENKTLKYQNFFLSNKGVDKYCETSETFVWSDEDGKVINFLMTKINLGGLIDIKRVNSFCKILKLDIHKKHILSIDENNFVNIYKIVLTIKNDLIYFDEPQKIFCFPIKDDTDINSVYLRKNGQIFVGNKAIMKVGDIQKYKKIYCKMAFKIGERWGNYINHDIVFMLLKYLRN